MVVEDFRRLLLFILFEMMASIWFTHSISFDFFSFTAYSRLVRIQTASICRPHITYHLSVLSSHSSSTIRINPVGITKTDMAIALTLVCLCVTNCSSIFYRLPSRTCFRFCLLLLATSNSCNSNVLAASIGPGWQ